MILQYKEFKAHYQWAPMPGLYVAELLDTQDVIAFSALTIQELKQMMVEAVEELHMTPLSRACFV